MSGRQGDPIVPRRIKPPSSWSWGATDDDKVEQLRVWWKERSDVQYANVQNAAKEVGGSNKCFPLQKSQAKSTSSSKQDEPLKSENPVSKSLAPQVQSVFSSKKRKVEPASSSTFARQEGTLSPSTRVSELKKFMEDEAMTKFHKHLIAFKDQLLKKGITKVLISGFINGKGGHVKIPKTLLGTLEDSQLLFVVCPESVGIPSVTEKLVLARAFGLHIVDSRFLIKWGETTVLPGLEEYPVRNEWASKSTGLSKFLTPLSDKIFSGQTFAFHDVKNWLISPENMASMITHLGGRVVSPEEQDNAGFGLSSTPVSNLEVFHPDWLVRMVLAGQDLPNVKWRLLDTEEDPVCSASQVATLHILLMSCVDYWLINLT